MTKETYNGYANYPTWNVCLWIDNDQGMSELISEYTAELIDNKTDRYDMVQALSEYIQENFIISEDQPAGIASDLLGYAIGMIDWYEVTDHYIEIVKEQWEYES